MSIKNVRQGIHKLLFNTPLYYWFLLTFLGVYLVLFIRPIFLKEASMQFPRYLPAAETIGWDFKDRLAFSEALLHGHTPYTGSNYYPPFEAIFFIPFTFIEYYPAYKILTLINVLSYSFLICIFPLMAAKTKKITPLHMLIILTSLFSYGFQFELERGQFNVIAVLFSLTAIYIFYYHSKYRMWAYVLLTISIQLKVYPLIFILLLIDSWKDWKTNIIRIGSICLANLSALFILGPSVFLDFVHAISSQMGSPAVSSANMSIQSFVGKLFVLYPNINSQLASVVILLIVGLCLVVILTRNRKVDRFLIDPNLLLACSIGAMIIPSISWDFKLSILSPSVAYFLYCLSHQFSEITQLRLKSMYILMVITFAAAYSWTLFSTYTNKPKLLIIQSNFPPLFMMLLIATIFAIKSSNVRIKSEIDNKSN